MKRWPWALFFLSAPLVSGCTRTPLATAPAAPVDTAAPADTETATFALG
jgi:hypothetical protein